MSEDYSFEDKIKSLFGGEREHSYEPDQWRRLARRLKDNDRPPIAWWQRWMPYGFLLLIGLLGWQLWQQQQLQRTVAALSEQLAAAEKKTSGPGVKQSQTITVYDTIYRQTIIETTTERRLAEGGRDVFSTNYEHHAGIMKADYPLIFTSQEEREQGLGFGTVDFATIARQGFQQYRALAERKLTDAAQRGLEARGPYHITDLLTASAVQQLPIRGIAFPTIPAPSAAPYQLSGASLWQRIRPQGYAVSIGGGQFKSWAYQGDEYGDLFGDLKVEMLFKNRFSLEVGVAYLRRSFEHDDFEDAPDDLPIVPPLDNDDELEEINGELQELQFPIGLRYRAWRSGRFQFHVGAGLMPLMGLSSSSIRYEYEDADDEDYTLSAPGVFPTGLRLGGVYGRLGVQAGLGKHWQFGVSATAMEPFGAYTYAYQRPSWGRWRVGAGYRLK